MKKTALVLMSLAVMATQSCKKSSSSTSVTPATAGFTWTENGGSTNTADSAFYTVGTGGAAASYIIAYKLSDPKKKMFEINLSNNTLITYNIPSQGDFILWNDTTFYGGTGGTVVVTANTGGKASGTFDITLTGGSVTAVKGSFTNIPVR